MSSSTENELESRVRSLTESLIQKQTMLEALSTDKHSLSLQLERLEVIFPHSIFKSLHVNFNKSFSVVWLKSIDLSICREKKYSTY